MQDIALIGDGLTGEYDISIENGDIVSTDDLSSSVLALILTDGRAPADQIAVSKLRRGWVGNAEPDEDGFELGSLIWTEAPSKLTLSTMSIIASHARNALDVLLSRGIAANIEVEGVLLGPFEGGINITITAPDGGETSQYVELWRKTSFVQTRLPERDLSLVEFDPAFVNGVVNYVEAGRSVHVVDDECRISVSRDLRGSIDYFQNDLARRPLLLLGSEGWFVRFDGVDDFLATNNQPFQTLREGTAFFTYKPTAAAVDGRRFFAAGVNGLADSVAGLAFIQQTADVIRMIGSNSTLDISVTGPGSGDDPVGVVFRWGPSANGADVETTDLVSDVDNSYGNDITSPNQLIVGTGFDGAGPDDLAEAGCEIGIFAIYSRKITDTEVVQFLDYASERIFTSTVGEHFTDCSTFTDNQGFTNA